MTVAESTSTLTGYEPIAQEVRDQYERDGFYVIKNALAETDRAYFENAVRTSRSTSWGGCTATPGSSSC